MIRQRILQLPPFLRDPILHGGKVLRTKAFGLPDAFDDIVRLAGVQRPAAILDIGAHEGETVLQTRKRLPDIPIHAFEPTPDSLSILRRRLTNCPNVTVHPAAVSDTNGTAHFHVNKNSQTNSLLENDSSNRDFLGDQTSHVGQIEVATVSLDSWMADNLPQGSIIIKADVQGAELKLIKGARTVLANQVLAFYTEVSLTPLYQGQGDLFSIHNAMTHDLPFRLYQIYRTRSHENGQAMWADAMWVRTDVLA